MSTIWCAETLVRVKFEVEQGAGKDLLYYSWSFEQMVELMNDGVIGQPIKNALLETWISNLGDLVEELNRDINRVYH